jgi:uncharacterized protein YqiB (DUF1249 family)
MKTMRFDGRDVRQRADGLVYAKNFCRLLKVIPALEGEVHIADAGVSRSAGFMDLHVDVMEKNDESVVIAMAHYYEQNGDKVPDPDMTVRLWRNGRAEALSFQDSTTYREVYPEPGKVNLSAKKELNDFLYLWLGNLACQGHKVETLSSD